MTQRRRFFPSVPAQKVPGKTAEFGMQLQPLAVAAVPDGCDLYGAGWFSPAFGASDEWSWEAQADGKWMVSSSNATSMWEGGPGGELTGWRPPVPSAAFRCVGLQVVPWVSSTPHVGVIQGVSMSDARWEAVWDKPSLDSPAISEVGSRFDTWGNVIIVRQFDTGYGGIDGMDGVETLTATAFCGGSAVATLVLHCRYPAY